MKRFSKMRREQSSESIKDSNNHSGHVTKSGNFVLFHLLKTENDILTSRIIEQSNVDGTRKALEEAEAQNHLIEDDYKARYAKPTTFFYFIL